MSDNVWDLDDDDNDNSGDGIKQLRKQFRELQRQNNELKESNAELAAKVRTGTITEVLAAKGVNPKVARLIPRDVELDGIEAWLEDMKDVLPAAAPAAPPADGEGEGNQPPPSGTPTDRPPLPDANVVETWQRLANVTGNGAITPTLSTLDPKEKAMRELAADPTIMPEELSRRLAEVLAGGVTS